MLACLEFRCNRGSDFDEDRKTIIEILAETSPRQLGVFIKNREISACARLRGGAGRTRTSNQTIISR
jgi:hypothetical protein